MYIGDEGENPLRPKNIVEVAGFTHSPGLEIEISRRRRERNPPPRKRKGRGGRRKVSRGTTGPEGEPVPVNKH